MHFHRGLIRPLRRRDPKPRRTSCAGADEPARSFHACSGRCPAVALVDEIEAGNIRALFVTGGNPLTAFPQPASPARRVGDARCARGRRRRREPAHRRSRPTCCRRPASWNAPTSRSPSSPRSNPALQATRPVVEPVADRRPVWWMFAALNAAMGRGEPGHRQSRPDRRAVPARRACVIRDSTPPTCSTPGPHGIGTPIEYGWVHDELLVDGRWHIAPAPLLDRLARYVDPEPDRVRARAAARDGVEQLHRVRRRRRPGRRAHASRCRGEPGARHARDRSRRHHRERRRRRDGAPRSGVDLARPRSTRIRATSRAATSTSTTSRPCPASPASRVARLPPRPEGVEQHERNPMRAWVVNEPGPIDDHPLELVELPVPTPGPGEIRVRVADLRRVPHRPAPRRR